MTLFYFLKPNGLLVVKKLDFPNFRKFGKSNNQTFKNFY